MDIPDRIESRDSLVIPEHLVFAFDDWISELFRRALDAGDEVEGRAAAIKAVHVHDAFVAGTLTPAQLAELTQSAAHWMEPRWPSDPGDADTVARLLDVSRELLELRDRAQAIASKNDNISRVLTVEPGWRGLPRSQTLAVLEFHHDLLEDARDLAAAELLAVGSIFRDAIAVLDTIGWVAGEQDAEPAQVTVSAGHLGRLEQLRADMVLSILDSLSVRDEATDPDEIARIDRRIRDARSDCRRARADPARRVRRVTFGAPPRPSVSEAGRQP
jgi:hypothetical protein